jgi:hypothetical protein
MKQEQKQLEQRRTALDTFMKNLAIVKRPPTVFRALYEFVDAQQTLKASRAFWEAVRGEGPPKVVKRSAPKTTPTAAQGTVRGNIPSSYWTRNQNLLLSIPVLLLLMATWCSAQFAFTLCCFLLGAATVYLQRHWTKQEAPEQTKTDSASLIESSEAAPDQEETMAAKIMEFQKTAKLLGEWKPIKAPSVEEQLQCYGLYKQSTKGDVQGARPGMFDVKVRSQIIAHIFPNWMNG